LYSAHLSLKTTGLNACADFKLRNGNGWAPKMCKK